MITVPELKTQRCALNGITEEDFSTMHQIFDDQLSQQYLPELYELVAVQGGLQQMMSSFESYLSQDEGILWGIRVDNNLAGFIAVMDLSDNPTIFYAMHPEYRSKGYMKECMTTILNYLLVNRICDCLQTEAHEDNQISINILNENHFTVVAQDKQKIFLSRNFNISNDRFTSFISSI